MSNISTPAIKRPAGSHGSRSTQQSLRMLEEVLACPCWSEDHEQQLKNPERNSLITCRVYDGDNPVQIRMTLSGQVSYRLVRRMKCNTHKVSFSVLDDCNLEYYRKHRGNSMSVSFASVNYTCLMTRLDRCSMGYGRGAP